MNMKERIEVVRAMELLARSVNDEEIFPLWLMEGVADGDINEETEDEDLECYGEDDKEFAALMDTFLHLMRAALASGGLYVDGVVSKPYNGN